MAAAESMIASADFEEMVASSLGDLLTAEGFRRRDLMPFLIRYERGNAFVDVEYEASRSRELTIWIGDADRNAEPPLTLPDALRATNCDAQTIERIARSQSGDRTFLERLLFDARELLSTFGRPFLRDDDSAFARARHIRSSRARAYTAELQNRAVLEAAEKAWHVKDYGRVHELLDPIRDSLSEPHSRRLRFAESRRG